MKKHTTSRMPSKQCAQKWNAAAMQRAVASARAASPSSTKRSTTRKWRFSPAAPPQSRLRLRAHAALSAGAVQVVDARVLDVTTLLRGVREVRRQLLVAVRAVVDARSALEKCGAPKRRAQPAPSSACASRRGGSSATQGAQPRTARSQGVARTA
jgi:hypothetical protein